MDYGDPSLYSTAERFVMWDRLVAGRRAKWSAPGSGPAGFWSVFDHEACVGVLAPRAPFTSEFGMLIGFDRLQPDRGGGHMIVATDGERHQILRRVIGPMLSQSASGALRELIEIEVSAVVADMRAKEVIDVAKDIAPRLPAAVVCALLGVPDADREYLIGLTDRAFAGPRSSGATDDFHEVHTAIFLYFDDLLRRGTVGDGVIAAMRDASELEHDDVLVNCYN